MGGHVNPQIEMRQLEALIPYARNARKHSEAQVAQIAASIREFGWTQPILVDGTNGVIAGHGRLLAARKLGLTEVPTIESRAPHIRTEARLHSRRQQNRAKRRLGRRFVEIGAPRVAKRGIQLADDGISGRGNKSARLRRANH
jgi:hypothetical protein